MAVKKPIALYGGRLKELQSGDTLTGTSSAFALTSNVISSNETITANNSAIVNRKLTINSGFKITIGLGSILGIS